MTMHDPHHPGAFISYTYMEPGKISGRSLAKSLGVSYTTVSRLINGLTSVTPEMAIRLSRVLGRSPGSWIQMQTNYDLWKLQKPDENKRFAGLKPIEFVLHETVTA